MKALFGIACAIGLAVGLGLSTPANASGPAKPNISMMPASMVTMVQQRKCKRASSFRQCLKFCAECGGVRCQSYCAENFPR